MPFHCRTPTPVRRAVPVAMAAVLLAACTPMLNMQATQDAVSQGLAEQLKLPMREVTCPVERPLKAGDTFECTAAPADGGRLFIGVTQKDDQGNIAWTVTRSEGVFNMGKVEDMVEQGLREQAGVETTVACGAPWVVGNVGETLECQARDAAGDVHTVVVTIKDPAGGVGWAMQ